MHSEHQYSAVNIEPIINSILIHVLHILMFVKISENHIYCDEKFPISVQNLDSKFHFPKYPEKSVGPHIFTYGR